MTFHNFTSIFYHTDLDNESKNSNHDENRIFMEWFEYIELTIDKETSIELVEYLHEYECLEYVSK